MSWSVVVASGFEPASAGRHWPTTTDQLCTQDLDPLSKASGSVSITLLAHANRPDPAMKIYTKTGDSGDTGLFGRARFQKDDPRVDAYGDVDELNAVLGRARAMEPMPRIDELLVPMQRDLFSIGALLATPDREKMEKHLSKASIDERRIEDLERAIDQCEQELEPLRAFIIPGGRRKGAVLHVARTVCRRAERRVVHLQREVEIPPLVVIYLNRLSDLLFMLARVANVRTGAGEVTW